MSSILCRICCRRSIPISSGPPKQFTVDFKSILKIKYQLVSRSLVVTDALLTDLSTDEYLNKKVSPTRASEEIEQSPEKQVTELLQILSDIPEEHAERVFTLFLSALRQDGQEHVANIFHSLHSVSDAHPMSYAHYQLLVSKTEQLCQYLTPSNWLMQELVNRKIFSDLDKVHILCETGFSNMSHKVVDILLHKADSAFDAFVDSLCTTNQEHVASLLGHDTPCLPMSEDCCRLLALKTGEIAQVLESNCGFIDELVTDGLLTADDREQIRQNNDTGEISNHIVEVVQRRPVNDLDKFLLTLSRCKKRLMSLEHRQLLATNTEKLCHFIDPSSEFLTELVDRDIFCSVDVERVRSKSTYVEMSLEIVNILVRKSDSSFGRFIEALESTEQEHVVHTLTGQDELPLSRVRRSMLMKLSDELVNRVGIDTLHTSLLAELTSSRVLAHVDRQHIEVWQDNKDRASALIDIIARKSQSAYNRFLQALKASGHEGVAERLVGIEIKGRLEGKFVACTTAWERNRIVGFVRRNMVALVAHCDTVDDLGRLIGLMEQNGFVVSESPNDDSNTDISFRCFTEESIGNLKRLCIDETLEKHFTQVFCPEFEQQGLQSLTLHITDDEFYKGAIAFILITSPTYLQTIREEPEQCLRLPLELLELVLMRTSMKLFTNNYKSHCNSFEALCHLRLEYSSLAGVCYNWWQTINGWEQSTTKHWFRHKLSRALQYVCRPYVVSPRLQSSLSVSSKVRGVTQCDNKLFVVCFQSNTIHVFEPNGKQLPNIELEELKSPSDIVSCSETKQLYVAGFESDDSGDFVWRVSLDGRQVEKWLPNETTTTITEFKPWTLSMTSERLLVTSSSGYELSVYSSDGVEQLSVYLPDMERLEHAVETSRGTFVVSHQYPTPSRICEVDVDGNLIHVYSDPEQLGLPRYLSLDPEGRLLVADSDHQRVLLLNNRLELERVLLGSNEHQLTEDPERLCYIEQTGQLVVTNFLSGNLLLFTVR